MNRKARTRVGTGWSQQWGGDSAGKRSKERSEENGQVGDNWHVKQGIEGRC